MKPSKKRVDALEGKVDLEDGRGFQPVVVIIDRSIDRFEAQRRSGPVIDSKGRKQVKIFLGAEDAEVL